MRKILLSVLVILCTAGVAWGSLDDLRRRAEAGDVKAQYDLAYTYMVGDGVAVDYSLAMQWAALAAKGDVNANGLMGYMYYMGLGVEQDYAEAFRQYTIAAAFSDPDMLVRLAFCYLRGQGVEQNTERGLKLMWQAADSGDAYAMFTLGRLYYEGQDAPLDLERAKTWFAKSVSARHPDGAVILCRIYMAEGRYVESVMWYTVLRGLAPQRADTLAEAMRAVVSDMTQAEQDDGMTRGQTWLHEHAASQTTAAKVKE